NAWNNDENLPIAGVSAKNAAWLAWQVRAELGRSLAVNSPVTPDGHVQFSVSLPAAFGGDKYFIDGVFQPLRYERDCERAVVAAGGVVNWVK
ncbi:hypothetical protein P2S20_23130, partial [Escherichia coli]